MVANEYYKKYLYGKLDLVFNDNGDKVANGFSIESKKESNNQNYNDRRYTTPVGISLSEALELHPGVHAVDVSNVRQSAIKLGNGIVGVKTEKGWYFPKLNLAVNCLLDHIRLFDNGYFSIGGHLYNPNNQLIYRDNNFLETDKGCFELYSDKYFLYKANNGFDKQELIDLNGDRFNIRRGYFNPDIKKQCILVRDKDSYYYGETVKRYKVILKDGREFHNGQNFSVYDEMGDCLILADKISYSGYYRRSVNSSDLYLILPTGKPLVTDKSYESFKKVNNRIITGYKNGRYTIFNMDGKQVTNEEYRSVSTFGIDKLICKGIDRKEYLLSEDGRVYTNRGYDLITPINDDYVQVRDNGEYFIVDKEGNKIHSNGKKPYAALYVYNNIIVSGENKLIIVPNKRLEEANVQKTLFGYTYNNGHETVHIKYQPVMLYGDYHALCVSNKKEFYLYNLMTKEYTNVGYISSIHYNETFIESHGKVLFPYNEKVLDITGYYRDKLDKKSTIKFNSNVGDIQTKEEYVNENKGDLALLQLKHDLENEKKAEEQREAAKRMEEKKAKEEAERKVQLAKQEQERKVREAAEKKRKEEAQNKALKKEYLDQMKELHRKLKELDNTLEIPRVPVDDLLIEYEDHKEINPAYVDYLDVVDLSHETFEKVKMSGLNFEGSNARFDPQVVYNKNLSGSNFTGIYFSPFADFTDVNIIGSKFSFDNDNSTIDMFNSSIASAYYDDSNTINEKSVDEYLKGETYNKPKTKHLEMKQPNN